MQRSTTTRARTRGYRQPHRVAHIPITETAQRRSWRALDKCTDAQALAVLEVLLTGPICQRDLAEALAVDYRVPLGTARAWACAALLYLHEHALIVPVGRDGRSTIWAVIP